MGCCELGGHSSVVPNTCTFVGITDERNFAQTATCDGNEHRVFIGAYDIRKSSLDAYNELNVGKCCEVKCDAQWCSGKDWGVNDRQCRTIYADRENMQPQDLVCPEGKIGESTTANAVLSMQIEKTCSHRIWFVQRE